MASACKCCTLFVLMLVVSGLCITTAADYNILDVDFALATKHKLWAAEHGRVYKDDAERSHRFEIFKDNLKYIEEFNNAGGHSYKLGLNQFADLTNEEFRDMYVGKLEMPAESEVEEGSVRSVKYEVTGALNVSLPDSIDWREKGAVGPVINQGKCGSCWAMASVVAIEGLHKIKTGNFTSLSAQQLIDCDPYNGGCKRGYMTKAYKYVKENGGITDEATYPFAKGKREKCYKKKAKMVVATIEGYKGPLKSEDDLAEAVSKVPVSAAIDSRSRSFQLYKSGIYDRPCSKFPNHAIAVVGYGGSGFQRYWIVKNSWGTGWGEDGYVRVKRGVDRLNGSCGIAMRISYPI